MDYLNFLPDGPQFVPLPILPGFNDPNLNSPATDSSDILSEAPRRRKALELSPMPMDSNSDSEPMKKPRESLTVEEKKARRRESNREAARKSRAKAKGNISVLEQQVTEEKQRNAALEEELQRMRTERDALKSQVAQLHSTIKDVATSKPEDIHAVAEEASDLHSDVKELKQGMATIFEFMKAMQQTMTVGAKAAGQTGEGVTQLLAILVIFGLFMTPSLPHLQLMKPSYQLHLDAGRAQMTLDAGVGVGVGVGDLGIRATGLGHDGGFDSALSKSGPVVTSGGGELLTGVCPLDGVGVFVGNQFNVV
ncbi:bZIP transcription factor [Carpediemonas membranifera]|uniref:BZIP transcription factor n=1 Tax=Carpediemonas membranifera TaxID=201153 RepID=A0A8J6APS1_9EUKA|nr:bZIP transcription factor [Carpediemonas membranifera]|eukprot:KAG9390346.1 bZIP transcription factor [Carpediemonas membranifera]